MSFQAYLDNIKAKTGKSPDDFKKLAEKKGLLKPDVKAGEIVAWLKKDFELGHGHAMAIYTVFKGLKEKKQDKEGVINNHFSGDKSAWRPAFDKLVKQIRGFGNDVELDPAFSYISFVRGKKKFAVVKVVADRMDIGVKLKGVAPGPRLEAPGTWNNLVTHRVRVSKPAEIDKEIVKWLQEAYEKAK